MQVIETTSNSVLSNSTTLEVKKGDIKFWRKDGAFGSYIAQPIFLRLLGNTLLFFKDNVEATAMARIDLEPTQIEVIKENNSKYLPKYCDVSKAFGLHFLKAPIQPFTKKTYFSSDTMEDALQWSEVLKKAQTYPMPEIDKSDFIFPPTGYLEKKNPRGIGWKRRFFFLETDKRTLGYYLESDRKSHKGSIYIPKAISIYEFSEGENCFQIHTRFRKYILKAPNAESQKAWMKALHACTTIISSKLLDPLDNTENGEQVNSLPLEIESEHSQVLSSVTESETVLKGYLKKLSPSKLKGWQRRFFWVKNFVIFWEEERTNQPSPDITGVRTIELDQVRSINKVDEIKQFTFNIVCEKRTYHLAAYNETEYSFWVDGLTKLKTALQCPTPYDMNKCQTSKRAIKSYPSFILREECKKVINTVTPSGIEEDEEAYHFKGEMKKIINKCKLIRKPTNMCQLEVTHYPLPSFFPTNFSITLYFPRDSSKFNGKLPNKINVPCTNSMTFKDLLRFGFLSGYFVHLKESQTGVEKFANHNVRDLFLEMTDPEKGIKVGDRIYKSITYSNCASSTEIISWLTSHTQWKRGKCIPFGLMLIDKKYITCVAGNHFKEPESLWSFEIIERDLPMSNEMCGGLGLTVPLPNHSDIYLNYNIHHLIQQMCSPTGIPLSDYIQDKDTGTIMHNSGNQLPANHVKYSKSFTGLQIVKWLEEHTKWTKPQIIPFICLLLDKLFLNVIVGTSYDDGNLYRFSASIFSENRINDEINEEDNGFVKIGAEKVKYLNSTIPPELVEFITEKNISDININEFYAEVNDYFNYIKSTIATDKSIKFVVYRGFFANDLINWAEKTLGWSEKKSITLGTIFLHYELLNAPNKEFSRNSNTWFTCSFEDMKQNPDNIDISLERLKGRLFSPIENKLQSSIEPVAPVLAESNINNNSETSNVKVKESNTTIANSINRDSGEYKKGNKTFNETVESYMNEWLQSKLYLRIVGTILYIDDLNQKLSSVVLIREKLAQRMPLRLAVEEFTENNTNQSKVQNVEEDEVQETEETCYNIHTVDRRFEIFIGNVDGIDLKLLRAGYGEDWHPNLTEQDLNTLQEGITKINSQISRKRMIHAALEEYDENPSPLNNNTNNSISNTGSKTNNPYGNLYRSLTDTSLGSHDRLPRMYSQRNTSGKSQSLLSHHGSIRQITPRNISGLPEEDRNLSRVGSISDNAIRKGLLGGVKIIEDSIPLNGIALPDMWVEVNFYMGGVEIAPPLRTRKSIHPKWDQWLRSNIPLNTLPKETRIYVTLFGTDPNGMPVSLGWTVWPLFNWNGYLPMGCFKENLRRGGKINPLISTAAPPTDQRVTLNARMPLSPLPIAFPEERNPYSVPEISEDDEQQKIDFRGTMEIFNDDFMLLDTALEKDPLHIPSQSEKELIWKYRDSCLVNYPQHLAKVMLSVNWRDPSCVATAHNLIKKWPILTPQDALELLESSFPDQLVRSFSVKCLENLSDEELVRYLPQLVQVLKYENYHLGPLAIFLVKRALNNILLVGQSLFWQLFTELDNPEIRIRYALLIEAIVIGAEDYLDTIVVQVDMVREFELISRDVQQQPNAVAKKNLLHYRLKTLAKSLPKTFTCPIDPTIKLKGINIEKCKVMDSNAAPLWIEFINMEDDIENFPVLIKCGDDLRQDILTLQMFSIMNNLWRSESIDLGMIIYKVVATGPTTGMVEIVQNSTTTAKIQKEFAGAAGAFSKKPLKYWFEEKNPTRALFNETVDNFTRSCAACCVATHVIGIGDRHNDNVMVTKSGQLFHIDFGHFLGNVLKFGTFNRDAAPFVLTPEFVHVMGDENGKDYLRFRELSTKAYIIVRKFHRIFINLFHMMLSTGIPQLRSVSDIEYLRTVFNLEVSVDVAEDRWKMLIDESLRTKTTQINNWIHNIAHPS